MKSPIGLDTAQSQALAAELNKLLASYQILYMNVRGFHWNIRGNQFFELHLKFEEIYNDLLLKVDALAERILTLHGVPMHSFSDYLKVSAIPEQKGCTMAAPVSNPCWIASANCWSPSAVFWVKQPKLVMRALPPSSPTMCSSRKNWSGCCALIWPDSEPSRLQRTYAGLSKYRAESS